MRKFTEEQHMFRDAYRRFLADEVAPHMPNSENRALWIAKFSKMPVSKAS